MGKVVKPLSLTLDAFTLQELLVVLLILIIISATAIVGFVNLYKNAIQVQEEEVIANLRTAIKRYFSQELTYPTTNPFELLQDPPPYWVCSIPTWDECLRNSEYGEGKWAVYQSITPPGFTILCPHYNVYNSTGCAWHYYTDDYSIPGGEKKGSLKLLICGTH